MSNYLIKSAEIDAARSRVTLNVANETSKFTLVLTDLTINEETPNAARLVLESHDWSVVQAGGVYFEREGNVELQAPQPSEHHVFDWVTKQWEDPRTLQDFKEAQWTLIKQARSNAEYAGFTWDGSTFDSDAISQQRITGAVALAQMSNEFTIGWVLANNQVRTLNSLDMMQVGAALGQHVAAQFAKGVLLREQIEAATTKEEVEAVVW